MKNSVSFLLALGQLAAVGHALDTRATAELECFAFDAVDEQTLDFNSYSACAEQCRDAEQSVFAVRASGCFCIDSLPSNDKKADPSECDEPCPGYMLQTCGGRPGYYSVGTVDAIFSSSSNMTNTTSTPSESATASTTASATGLPSSSSVPSNSTSSVTPSSSSASGSSASASPTVDSGNAAAPAFGASFTVVTSFVGAVAVLTALI